MIIDDALFKNLFYKIDPNKQNPVFYNYTGFFVDDKNNHIQVENVVSLNRTSSYTNTFSDYYHILVQLPKSSYLQLLTVNRKNLKFHLNRKLVSVLGTDFNQSTNTTDIYSAYLTENTSQSLENPVQQLKGNYTDDLNGLVEVVVQLVENGLSEYRLYEIGGVYRNVKLDTLTQGIMSHPIKTISTGVTANSSYDVDIYPIDNNKRYYQILIQNGVRITDLVDKLQDDWGIYQSGCASYLSKGMIYVFPLYDFNRYNSEKKLRLTIVKVPKNEMSNLTNSYVIEGNEVYVFATGDAKHIDNSDANIDNTGSGFRVANVDNLMKHFSETKDGNTVIPKGRNFVNASYDDRKSDVGDNIKNNTNLLSSNYFKDASITKAGLGNQIIIAIEAFHHDLCYPGMPIKYIYKHLNKVYSLFGVLHYVETESKTYKRNKTDTRYVSVSKLILFCERADK